MRDQVFKENKPLKHNNNKRNHKNKRRIKFSLWIYRHEFALILSINYI